MLGLKLRKEFQGRRLKGTAIELTNKNKTGATQVPAADFLKITYPTSDLLKTIEAAGPDQERPVTLKGERGQGKSHLMAALYHAFNDNDATQAWLQEWAGILGVAASFGVADGFKHLARNPESVEQDRELARDHHCSPLLG